MSDELAVVAFILIERLSNKPQELIRKTRKIQMNSLTVHRQILISILLTQKFFTDYFYGNIYVAQVGGMTLSELNALEKIFLEIIDFKLNVSED
jgi:hypothetical protein